MVTLESLYLDNCNIKNLDVLQSLVELKELNVNNNSNINITAIQYLKKLTSLDISNCLIRGITVLSACTILENLLCTRIQLFIILRYTNQSCASYTTAINSTTQYSNNTNRLQKIEMLLQMIMVCMNNPKKFAKVISNWRESQET
ncbi:Leucine-rich_repeat [Hexamita inflata]|uniref:Leucine-rich repeat n=1 Tax=Hexamita inflata TaxID=28002 RepID=A0AA86QCE8_9EUKA|nr:Leucine-rich repeat [Hexamita inflata]